MSAVFKKLNLKNQTDILVLNAPASFEPELAPLEGITIVRTEAKAREITFSLAFVTQQKEIDALAKTIRRKAVGDAVVWFAYPKASSRRFKNAITVDWTLLGEAGFESVSRVAIDEDWSAKRFRRAEFIEKMTRDTEWAMTSQGKRKTGRK
jgi:aspartate 1-decarboxylase